MARVVLKQNIKYKVQGEDKMEYAYVKTIVVIPSQCAETALFKFNTQLKDKIVFDPKYTVEQVEGGFYDESN